MRCLFWALFFLGLSSFAEEPKAVPQLPRLKPVQTIEHLKEREELRAFDLSNFDCHQTSEYESGELEDLLCLTCNIYHEARGQHEAGQKGVAFVTINRKVSWDKESLCSVIWQRGQFDWTDDGKSDRLTETASIAASFEVAQEVLSGQACDPTHGATDFHDTSVDPYWASAYKKTAHIGELLFYSRD